MRWLARIDPTRALGIAALWPVTLLALGVLLRYTLPLWLMRREGVIHVEVHMTPGAWPRFAALLVGPPLGFLIAWTVARRRFGPRSA